MLMNLGDTRQASNILRILIERRKHFVKALVLPFALQGDVLDR